MNTASIETKDRPPVTVKVEIDSTVDPMWVDHVTGGEEGFADAFMRDYSGYWMRGIEHDPRLGWLAYEHGDDALSSDAENAAAVAAWRAGLELPKGFLRLNIDAAKRAWVIGVQHEGVDWFENGDGVTYDKYLQIALGVTWVHDGKVDARYG